MKSDKTKPFVKEPSAAYNNYSYADYLTWQLDEMVEIIKGRVFKMTAAPNRIHQKIALKLASDWLNLLEEGPCEVYVAPFDVRLPTTSSNNEDIFTVVQPDISIICDKNKLDEAGCLGAPDLIVEILSPGNNKKELKNKFEVYQESGVKEYWVIHPSEQTLLIYTLKSGSFIPSRLYTSGDTVRSTVIQSFTLDVGQFFKGID